MPNRLPDAIFAPSTTAAPRPGHVLRKADVIFRSGDYDFPAELGGPFSMTPADIKAALADFKPIELEDTHAPSVFNGKLGSLVKPIPSADFSSFGGEIEIPQWFDSLFKGEPIKLSARWNRKTKKLKKLAVVPDGRISDAAMFAAFAAYPPDGDPAPDPDMTPAPDEEPSENCSEAACHAAEGIDALIKKAVADPDVSEAERKKFAAIKDLVESLMDEDEQTLAPGEPTPSTTIPPDAAMSAKEKAQEARIKQLEDALFAQTKERFRAEGRAFAHDLFRAGKITPAEATNVVEAYFQAAMDDHAHPKTDVCFSDDKGQQMKGTRLQALKAMLLNQPANGLSQELTGDGRASSPDALFNRTTTPDAADKPMTAADKDKLLGMCDVGKGILAARRAKANGSR